MSIPHSLRQRELFFLSFLFPPKDLISFKNNVWESECTLQMSCFFPLVVFLKYHFQCRYDQLTEIAIVDFIKTKTRFKVIFNFLSTFYQKRFCISVFLSEKHELLSLTTLYASANWLEREAWEFFGIFFVGHPDLRRLLTDYGFSGYPLRKDFPLTGFLEVFYDERYKQVVYKPVSLTQEFRVFRFLNPWRIK